MAQQQVLFVTIHLIVTGIKRLSGKQKIANLLCLKVSVHLLFKENLQEERMAPDEHAASEH